VGPTSTAGDPGAHPLGWVGWGAYDTRPRLEARTRALLAAELGPLGPSRQPVALDDVRVAPSRLPPEVHASLVAVVGAEAVRDDHRSRVEHSGGQAYLDLVSRRAGDALSAPDAVVRPGSHDEVVRILEICRTQLVAVVPYGGGTSVVGGVTPERHGFDALVALDLGRLTQVLDLDETSGVASFQAGIRGPQAEQALRARGYTLGHYPQSYAYATLGGMVATRSAGQASTGYGRIDQLLVGARCATPVGTLAVGHPTPTAAGPDLTALLAGSEGTLGVLTEVSLRVRPCPELERYEAWALPSFAVGAAALRDLVRRDAAGDVTRLSDEQETRITLAQAEGWKVDALHRYLAVRGLARPCLLVLGWEGAAGEIAGRRRRTRAVLRGRRAVPLGSAIGDAWAAHRFAAPRLRDALLDAGVVVDTLETATSWRGLGPLYLAVRDAVADTLRARGTPGLVLTHISHLYPTGASLYLTWLARQERGAERDQWQAVKRAAGDAIVAHGGTITHHHAIGRDHRAWMSAEVGAVGLATLRAVKVCLDPTGILNPGKLLPPAATAHPSSS
jgi:alkyldihydroxyacetonephosphate synthase